MKAFVLALSLVMLTVTTGWASATTPFSCDGLKIEQGTWYDHLYIWKESGSFGNLGGALSIGELENPRFVESWTDKLLQIRRMKVAWNADFATYSNNRLLVVNRDGDHATVSVGWASLANEDRAEIELRTLQWKASHTFYNCH